ncbi:hypothetical protein HDU67_006442 [Dinochytrium kinnereticum]|nr:hypothetical protein HDU67_006442 [Dinochytrium kinnereticum]
MGTERGGKRNGGSLMRIPTIFGILQSYKRTYGKDLQQPECDEDDCPEGDNACYEEEERHVMPLIGAEKSDIIHAFPIIVKKKLIWEVVQCLIPTSTVMLDPSLTLTSPAHVKWVMELIGHGFSLPIEDVSIINGCMLVYTSWLMETSARPAAVRYSTGTSFEQLFWQAIYKHISLVFEPRKQHESHVSPWINSQKGSDESGHVIDTHVDLCRTALKLYLNSVRALGRDFSEETWTIVLKVALGVADCLLSEPCGMTGRARNGGGRERGSFNERIEEADDPGPKMADALCEDLIRVLIEREMKKFLSIYIIGNVNAVDSPQNFEVAILGLARIVDAYHSIGSTTERNSSSASPPDGNTILDMFGDWLFEAILRPSPKYEDGVSQAYAILCSIFTKPQTRNPFSRSHLERFYTSLKSGLKSDSQSLTSIIMNSESLFTLDLEGIRVLVPHFVIGLKRILPKLEKDFILNFPVDELRRAAFKIIGTVFAVPNLLDGVSVLGVTEMDRLALTNPDLILEESILIKRILTYYHRFDTSHHFDPSTSSVFYILKPRLLEMLLASLKVETSAANSKLIINLLCSFAFEEAAFCPGAPVLVVGAIKEKIAVRTSWQADVLACALESLSQLTALWKHAQGNF